MFVLLHKIEIYNLYMTYANATTFNLFIEAVSNLKFVASEWYKDNELEGIKGYSRDLF
jgi:hypothetical protein